MDHNKTISLKYRLCILFTVPIFGLAGFSPVYSHISTTLQGLTSIRAMGIQEKFTETFNHKVNNETKIWFLLVSASRCLTLMVELTIALNTIGCLIAALCTAGMYQCISEYLHISPGCIMNQLFPRVSKLPSASVIP